MFVVCLQVTSPLRRYGDLAVHLQLKAHLCGEPLPFTETVPYAVDQARWALKSWLRTELCSDEMLAAFSIARKDTNMGRVRQHMLSALRRPAARLVDALEIFASDTAHAAATLAENRGSARWEVVDVSIAQAIASIGWRPVVVDADGRLTPRAFPARVFRRPPLCSRFQEQAAHTTAWSVNYSTCTSSSLADGGTEPAVSDLQRVTGQKRPRDNNDGGTHECPVCNRCFVSSHALRSHIRDKQDSQHRAHQF